MGMLLINPSVYSQSKIRTEKTITLRNFTMSTVNYSANSPDFFANALGGNINLKTNFNNLFTIETTGYVSGNLSDPSKFTKDGKKSRYESGLFDVTNPKDRTVMVLGELLMSKKLFDQKFKVEIGRKGIMTPLHNMQPGRMIPTLTQGLYSSLKVKNTTLNWFLIHKISPRSTSNFYSIRESINLFNLGKTATEESIKIGETPHPSFISIFGFEKQVNSSLQVNYWNYYTDQLFTHHYLEGIYKKNKHTFQGQGIVVHRNNSKDYILTYMPSKVGLVAGLRYTYQVTALTSLRVSATRVTRHGNFLFPRAWGVEPLYTFLTRERTEGNSNSTSFVGQISTRRENNEKFNLAYSFANGYYLRPQFSDLVANRSRMPSYFQLVSDFRLELKDKEKDVHSSIRLLITLKQSFQKPKTYDNFNKTEMINFNLIIEHKI